MGYLSSQLPAILQRSRLTPTIFGNCLGQPPSNLPAISRRCRFTPAVFEIATANHPAIWFFFYLYCMVFVLYCGYLFVLCSSTRGVLPVISQPFPSDPKLHPKSLKIARANRPAISQPSLGDLQLQPTYLEQVAANQQVIPQPACSDLDLHRPRHFPAIAQPSPSHLQAI